MEVTLTVRGQKHWTDTLEPRRRRSITLGSAPDCDVVLGGTGIMPRHAEIGVDESGPWLCAHAALTVDGRTVVGWALIASGARLVLGEHDVVFEARASSRASFEHGPTTTPPSPPHQTLPTATVTSVATTESLPADIAQLGELFALPPPELIVAPKETVPWSKRRFLSMPVRSWILGSVTITVGLFFFATREVPRASAGGPVTTPTVRVVASGTERATPKPRPRIGAPVTLPEIRAAADLVFAGDRPGALSRYRVLSERDPRFAPFARALEQRLKQKCTPGTSGAGSECP